MTWPVTSIQAAVIQRYVHDLGNQHLVGPNMLLWMLPLASLSTASTESNDAFYLIMTSCALR